MGDIAESAKSTVLPNANIANNLIVKEQHNLLPFLMPKDLRDEVWANTSRYFDKSGRLKAHRLINRLYRLRYDDDVEPIKTNDGSLSDSDASQPSSVDFTEDYDNKYERIRHLRYLELLDVVKREEDDGSPAKRFAIHPTQMVLLLRQINRMGYFDFSARNELDKLRKKKPERPMTIEEDYFERVKDSVQKYRSLRFLQTTKLGKKVIDVAQSRVTSTEVIGKTKKRASWFVEYGTRRKPNDIRIAECIYFVTVDLPFVESK